MHSSSTISHMVARRAAACLVLRIGIFVATRGNLVLMEPEPLKKGGVRKRVCPSWCTPVGRALHHEC